MLAVEVSFLGLVIGVFLAVVVSRQSARKGLRAKRAGHPWVSYAVLGLFTAIVFLAAFWEIGWSLELLRAFALISALVVLAAIDLTRGLLPNVVVVPACVAGLILSPLVDPVGWWTYPTGALLVGGGLFAISLAYPGGMGMGDVKMGAMLGTFLGPYAALAVFLGALCGAVVGGVLLSIGEIKRGTGLPFGTFMAAGALISLLFGPEIWTLYVEWT